MYDSCDEFMYDSRDGARGWIHAARRSPGEGTTASHSGSPGALGSGCGGPDSELRPKTRLPLPRPKAQVDRSEHGPSGGRAAPLRR